MKFRNLELQVVEIEGIKYIRPKEFAIAVNKSVAHVYQLINPGNVIRKLKVVRISGVPFIPLSELTAYIFTTGKSKAYRFKENGDMEMLSYFFDYIKEKYFISKNDIDWEEINANN